jgi:hypothetical protein
MISKLESLEGLVGKGTTVKLVRFMKANGVDGGKLGDVLKQAIESYIEDMEEMGR